MVLVSVFGRGDAVGDLKKIKVMSKKSLPRIPTTNEFVLSAPRAIRVQTNFNERVHSVVLQ